MKLKSLALSIILVALAQVSFAADSKPFTEESFKQSLNGKNPVVVAFHSDSCGSCKIQKPNLEAVLHEDPLKSVDAYMANFEATSEFRKKLDKPVRGPSTILVFKDGKEVSRILGETNKEKIRELIATAIAKN